ncbi:MAG: histidinol-phosphatase [Rhizobiales bacterium 65-9]|nr:histidinol-phosphatase [Hyphomicrobiales bacterium]OJY38562.1 MAG: histidinol-phosphatase [Rhizobiales bacterium 65-9]
MRPVPVDLEQFLHRLADASGDAILPFFRSRLTAHDKSQNGAFDPVTEADKAAEVIIRRMIREAFPTHAIHGEEFEDEEGSSDFRWVIDPIDGTRAFISGLPVWGTLIGLTRAGRPALGLMNQPFTRERFWGDGGRAQWRGASGDRPLRTRSCDSLSAATLMTTTPAMFKGDEADRYAALERQVRLPRYGCDCYAYCMLAAGHVDLVVESGLKAVDIVPLAPIIEGAGGIITTWSGEPVREGGAVVVAGDQRAHEAALKILNA